MFNNNDDEKSLSVISLSDWTEEDIVSFVEVNKVPERYHAKWYRSEANPVMAILVFDSDEDAMNFDQYMNEQAGLSGQHIDFQSN